MNKIEKNDFRSLKREKLKSFLSERRSQKDAQAKARKETARRLTSERRARLVSERTYARQPKESAQGIKIKSRVKINAVKSDKPVSLPSRSKSETRKVFTGGKTQSDSREKEAKLPSSVFANNQQAKNRQKLLAYLEKHRIKKFEIIAGKIKQKEAAASEKQSRRAELERQKLSLRQQKIASQSQQKAEAAVLLAQKKKEAEVIQVQKKQQAELVQTQKKKEAEAMREESARKAEAAKAQAEAGEAIPTVIGQSYKRQQLLSYLKKRKSGEKTFAIPRRELKKIAEETILDASSFPAVPEASPVSAPLVTPPIIILPDIVEAAPENVSVPLVTPPIIILPDTVETAPENVSVPIEEKPAAGDAEKSIRRRLKLPFGKGKKIPSAAAPPLIPKSPLPPKKPFQIIPFLKAHYIKIIFLLLVLGWFAEIAMLKHLESVRQQIEQASSIARPSVPGEAITTAKLSPLALGTTRVEGIRDPFSNELWRIQEITPSQARAVGVRTPVRMPVPPSLIKPLIPILITKPPEFTPPEIAKAIPESAKLGRIPLAGSVSTPLAGSVSTPSAPVSSLRFRGLLNVAGIDYFFVEGASGGYRVRIGDTVEGFKIYDYRNGVLYFAKDGYTYQLNEERASPPLRYRGRMIMAGQEYFFLEGQRTYRAVIGEEIEGYQLVKRVGDYLYFVNDGRLYYLKQE